jgi:hypothetical protein
MKFPDCDKNVILKTLSFALLHVFRSLPNNGHGMNKRSAEKQKRPIKSCFPSLLTDAVTPALAQQRKILLD